MSQTLFWIAAACALAYLAMTARPASLMRSAVKTASVALLALMVLVSGGPVLLVLALALCALGDWLLSRETEATFMAGVGAFAAGHLAYVALFLTHPASDTGQLAAQWPLVAGLAALGLVMASLLAPRAGDLKGPVLAYVPIILGMGLAALTLPQAGVLAWVLPAAAAFIASDMILATEKFLLPPGHPALRLTPYLVWPLYWGAQMGFALALT
ncbi:membrane protein, putative [Ruegeria pomeroyi DSS-3]|uniref:Membrane protein, putative n=1 Tax=Ruegeria pomeroyi (strain ATCC 700808 / DSM 15171 / DSS-3) TaxID=246200 RepID=Q5LTS3_RUEPO|nr:membrane protein, putative [Ruegeria pomeroyi DSS-3]